MTAEKGNFKQTAMCRALGVTRQGYHQYIHFKSKRKQRKTRSEFWAEFDKQRELARLSDTTFRIAPFALEPELQPDDTWFADVMSVFVRDAWCHVAVVFDVAERRALGWHVRLGDAGADVGSAWEAARARTNRKPRMLHSDRSALFAETAFTELLERDDVKASMRADARDLEQIKFAEMSLSMLRLRVLEVSWEDLDELQMLVFECFGMSEFKERPVGRLPPRPRRAGSKRKPKSKSKSKRKRKRR